ncbi:MAG: hypothetical protein ACK5MP_11730 [Nostocoides sp.]
MPQPSQTPRPISRRRLAATGAWTTPVIIIGAASRSLAASATLECVSGRTTLQWSYGAGSFTGTPIPSDPLYGSTTITGYTGWTYSPYAFAGWGASGLTITTSSTYSGGSLPTTASLAMRGAAGGYTSGVNMGWYGGTGFSGGSTSGTSVMGCWTFAFNQSLCNLTFAITDIDWGARESVYVSSTDAAYTSSIVDSAAVHGSGTSADPWTSSLPGQDLDNATSTRGNVIVTFTAPVTTFTLCADSRDATANQFQENVAISSFTFDCTATGSCP